MFILDKFTIRGILYVLISGGLLSYELLFVEEPRILLLIMYPIVILIGLVCIFWLEEN